ncbi:low-density lipoprotein receptor-related protein 2-like isoform X1 [Gambusia affinis]|uniref:low-density lipoprotein receptor-related protein 2-like isoform X1 n=1 Tax=Gambusia affinis TaxID=33528 RepID=UPI001CDB70DF|nr:low-density lipoprotein receptor-related protein 2-like isoform X1 [Gambusia affinis]
MLVRMSRGADMDLRLVVCFIFLPNLRFSSGQLLSCSEGQWQCDDGTCITAGWRCDGEGDCLDGSDEMDCSSSTDLDCPAGQFPCMDSVGCIDMSARCDGQKQCPTGSDEENCPATEGCLDSEWLCGNRICIPKELHCNGQNDCMDNSDEDCGKCSENGLQCPEGKCLSAEERCDGHVHCSDGSDEPITCGRTCSMYNGGCSHICTDESWGVQCICPVGHKLSPNGAVCEDLDECASSVPRCAHHCTNTIGSYYCHCREGFKLSGDSTCQALGNATQLLMMQRNSIGLLNVKSKQFTAIKAPVSDPVASTYDITRGWFYWADGSGSIYKTNGRNTWTTFTGPPGIKGLACDWLNGYLFWTNKKTESIYMQSSDKSFTALLSKNVSPSELVLLPIERFMFWINDGLGDRVTLERSWMDGSDRSTLVVLTAQFAHSLTSDVAVKRLYWISDSKRSVETVKADGTGRYSFIGLFNKRPASSLAVFESMFFWVDQKGLWQAPQDQSKPKKFIRKTDLPLLSVFHELQQPKGASPCAKTSCLLCQLTKNNPAGFTCACPYFKVLLPDGTCKYPRFLYGTLTTINLLEFKGKESSETELFSSKEGIMSFDVDWFRDWLYWANHTGHVQRTKLTLDKTEFISTPLPVCLLSVDQRSGNLFWVSCDQNIIGTSAASSNYPQQLYHTTKEISSFYLDWLRGGMFWLEEDRIFGMGMMGEKPEELLRIPGGVRWNIAFDLRASSLLWNSKRGGLTTLSLLKEKSHQAGRRWNISGPVVAAFEPFLLSISNKVMTLWDRRDGSKIQSVSVKGPVLRIIPALGDIQTVPDTQVCNVPSWLCHQSSICLPQNLLCDGKRDCPEGDDEELCVSACPQEDFMCMDRRKCIPRILLCDGRAHCHDGSDEVDCPTVAAPLSRTNVLKCRSGSVPCQDGTECVLYNHVCDGEADCKDGSDELGCDATQEPTSSTKPNKKLPVTKAPVFTLSACLSPSVLCPSFKAYICISQSQFCDGVKDCPDGFDEQNCAERCLLRNDFLCKNHWSCVPKSSVCDGRPHCLDGSDEVDCPNVAQGVPHNGLKCRFGSKRCRDGLSCVIMSHICDGERDCRDGSDEDDCDTTGVTTTAPTTPPCTSPSVLCPGSSTCIKPTQMCDGKRDCPDGSDEKCVTRCPDESDFRCKDRRSCVPLSQVCDGRAQCNDGSDELNCPSEAPPAAPNKILKCRFGSKLCQDGLGCVLISHICDGERDCQDGSDEDRCDGAVENVPLISAPTPIKEVTQPPTMPPCTSPSVLCPGSTICIKRTQMCDGKRDCPDGSDEKCIKRCSSDTDFRCKDRLRCIPKSQVCDGRSQCTDGSDEVNCRSAEVQEAPKEVLKCRFGSRPCNDRTACVLLSHICDGETDCQDGSDEEACDSESDSMGNGLLSKSPELTKEVTLPPTKPPCTSPSVLCPGSSICIKHTQVCDGKEDCPDGSDEKCIERCPSKRDFLCRDRRHCIPKTQVCDGRSHCNDGSDEVGCQSVAQPASPTKILKCRFGFKLCRDRTSCVLQSHICDGAPDCQDGSDEEECDESLTLSPTPTKEVTQILTKPPCTSPSVLCPGTSVCVKTTQMCDGTWDCPDGYDEKCVERCLSNYFHCKDRRSCIPRNQVCDGRSQCNDGSDEVNCQSATPPAARTEVLKCHFGSKLCDDGTSCVLMSHICDGDEDCHDGSDEEGCDNGSLNRSPTPTKEVALVPTNPPCISPSVLCPGSSICIKSTQMCDGTRDCPDGFDEKCVNRCPYDTDFRCNDRQRCIPKTKVCDGRSQCNDGSDEVNCQNGEVAPKTPSKVPKCRFGSKLCRDRMKCVLLSHVCDGEADCQDGSDEEGCGATETDAQSSVDNDYMNESPKPAKRFSQHTTTLQCTSPSVLCPGTSICLKATQICDRRKDCPDGSDEKCVRRCPGTDFRCKDRRSCIPRNQVCDGRSQCIDGSDEVNCRSVESRPSQTKALKCRMGSRMCRDGTGCVLFSHVCDGESDCRDGSDEEGCDAAETIDESPSPKQFCSFPSVLCPDSNVCINPSQLCDGIRDCPDGSDENCVKKCADRTDFLCKDRRSCVSRTLVCDGRSHCYDGSDEADCRHITAPPLMSSVLKCRMGSKPCKDGKDCVLFSHVCDGEIDCMDESDEEGCQETCDEGEFQCAHGKMCIPQNEVCDGKPQCRDHSDEVDCWQRTKGCEYRCADGKRCIPKKFLCDGEPDCLDGTDELNCDSAPTDFPVVASTSACITPSVLCPGSSQCISQHQLCDGQSDCPDGFDEKECVVQCENPGDFLCKDQRKCIPKTQVCDGRNNCPDGSDEKQCQSELTSASPLNAPRTRHGPLKCRTGFKLCKNGLECIMYSHVCDGEHDCQDGSDEEGCEKQCKPGQFQCSHGRKCIKQEQVCDGQNDCQDHSDETDCSKPIEGCHHLCDNKTRCVPKNFLCDGEKDCTDGSDEDKCGSVACAPDQHRCESGQCISEAFKCDGYPDCHDHSDEAGCPRAPRCPAQLRCPHSHECLQKEWLCDGEEDCKDGSDENNCNNPPTKCRKYQFQCRDSGLCIPQSWRCDGKEDCDNGVDEDKCTQRKCPYHLYQCGSKECLETRLVCNGINNCIDGSDEGVGCAQRNCSSPSAPTCDHRCVSTPNGPRCYCGAGFRLQSSSKSCMDIDECTSTPATSCKHLCQNTRGSYSCLCHPGFYLEPDNKSCKTKDEPLLLASVQSEMLILGVHSGTLQLLSSADRPVFALDFHWAEQRVYWQSPDHQSIRWADMKSKTKGTLTKGVKSDSIAVDWVGKNLYWVDRLVGQILAIKLSSSIVKSQDYTVVLGENLEQTSSLVLIPDKGLMLWSEIGSIPQIEQSGMDGSQRKVVVSQDLSWPVSLAYDFLDDRIYWADEKLHCIGSASLDGDNIKILQLTETPSPFSVAVFSDHMFWSDTKRRTVRSADKKTGKNQTVLLKRPGQPFGLKLMHALSQPAVSSPCDHLQCSNLCLLAPAPRKSRAGSLTVNAAVCRCPKGLLLSQDRMTCVLPKESSFILVLSRNKISQIYLRSMRRYGIALQKMPNGRDFNLPGVPEAMSLDISFSELLVFVAYLRHGSVDVLKLSNSLSKPELVLAGQIIKLQDDSVTALAVDWVTSNLYWSSMKRPDIHVTSRLKNHTTSLLQGPLIGVSSITLHPSSGRLCYFAIVIMGSRSQTELHCAWMDGRNKVVLWKRLSIPISMVFTNDGSRIYWADTGEGIIGSIGVDGSGYKEYKTGPNLLVSFTLIENSFFWVTQAKDVSKLWFSDGLQPKQLWFETKTKISEIRSYNNETQSGSNHCSIANGGCVHLCLPYPGGRTCRCAWGFYSANDTSCVPLPSCPSGEESCLDGSKCIGSKKFCDGRADCPDQSDEQDCPASALFGTIVGGDQSSQPSLHQPDTQENAIVPNEVLASCDLQLCNGHGNCITEGKVTRCHCLQGYEGEFCQTQQRQSHPAIILVSICLVFAVVVGALIFTKRRWENMRNTSADKENLMTNMAIPDEQDSDSEELESPVDVKNPLPIK